MVRGTRVDAPGAFHHVMVRGIDGRELFRDDDDRREFLSCLRRAALNGGARCAAWALMPNHVHLLIRSGAISLSALMQRVGTVYVRYFNKRHDRTGYLFQGRFRSILVEDDSYLLVLVRYIHRNPLEAGLVGSLDDLSAYPWTGHVALMGGIAEPFQLVDEVLALFGPSAGAARRGLVAWMADGSGSADAVAPRDGARHGADKLVVRGDPLHRDAQLLVPVDRAIEHLADLSSEGGRQIAAMRQFGGLEGLIDRVCEVMEVDAELIRAGRRSSGASGARAAIASIARRQLGLSFAEMAPALGVSASALSHAERRGVAIARRAGLAFQESNS